VDNQRLDINPNPVIDELFIRSNDFIISEVQITDFLGNIILASNINNAQTRIDLSSLSAGIYHLTITDSHGKNRVRNVVKS